MVTIMHNLGLDIFKKEFAGSPKLLAYMEANFQGAGIQDWKLLIETADESPFSLRQWVEALIVLGHWLDARGLYLPMEDQVGYVCCSADAAGSGANLEHLPSLTEAMLQNYGCERAEPRD